LGFRNPGTDRFNPGSGIEGVEAQKDRGKMGKESDYKIETKISYPLISRGRRSMTDKPNQIRVGAPETPNATSRR
jgi:hypothetical protein